MTDEDLFSDMLDAPTETDEPYPYPFFVGEYDERIRDRVKTKMPSWGKLVTQREPEFKEFDRLISSMFFSLYNHSQQPMSPLTESAQKIAQLLDIAKAMPEWEQLSKRTKSDHVMSGLASVVVGEHIVIPEPAPGGGGGQDGTDQGDQESSGPPEMGNGDEVRQAMAQALQAANEAADNADTLSQLWGDETGNHDNQDPENLLAMVKMLRDSDRLKLVARMLGRLRNQLYRSQMSKVDYIPEVFVDVELGNNIEDIMPSSRMLLADPELEVLFFMKFVEKALLQQVREGHIPVDQGPIVTLVDISGSMDDSIGDIPGVGRISRMDWALAVALTLSILARQQDREYYIGLFDTRIVREVKSSDGPISTQKLVELLSVNSMGGTKFEPPLQRGLDVMLESAYNKADLVFVTDGYGPVSEQFLEKFKREKEERGFRTLGVACASIDPAILTGFCDRILHASNVMRADDASAEIFSIGE